MRWTQMVGVVGLLAALSVGSAHATGWQTLRGAVVVENQSAESVVLFVDGVELDRLASGATWRGTSPLGARVSGRSTSGTAVFSQSVVGGPDGTVITVEGSGLPAAPVVTSAPEPPYADVRSRRLRRRELPAVVWLDALAGWLSLVVR